MCVHMHMCVCVCACACTRVYVRLCVHTYMCVYVYTHVCMCVRMHAHTCARACVCTRISVHTHMCVRARVCACMCVCVRACVCVCVHACTCAQSCPTVCDPMSHSPPGSSVHGIDQGRILEGVAIFSSKWSSQPRDPARIPCVSCLAGRVFTTSATWVHSRCSLKGFFFSFFLLRLAV